MNYRVLILSEAEREIDNAFIWYELNQIGLGKKFFETIDKSVNFIANRPYSSPEIFYGLRRLVIKKFPYGIYYKIIVDLREIQIIAVLHFQRNLESLRKRV